MIYQNLIAFYFVVSLTSMYVSAYKRSNYDVFSISPRDLLLRKTEEHVGNRPRIRQEYDQALTRLREAETAVSAFIGVYDEE